MGDRKHSVLLAYVHGGVVENGFMESIVGALAYDAGHGNLIADVRGVEGLYIADNRDLAARAFMRYKLCGDCRAVLDNKKPECPQCQKVPSTTTTPEWLWFLDTDIVFDPDTLERLLSSAHPVERPIMSALYFGYMNNGASLVPVWYDRENDGRITNLNKFGSGVQRLGVVGMGCCLIHRSVFEKFGDTYAETGWLYFGHDRAPWVPKASVDNDMMPFGEDNCFCYRADRLGIPIHGVGSVAVEHRKKRYESIHTFMASFAQQKVDGGTMKLVRQPAPSGAKAQSHISLVPDKAVNG